MNPTDDLFSARLLMLNLSGALLEIGLSMSILMAQLKQNQTENGLASELAFLEKQLGDLHSEARLALQKMSVSEQVTPVSINQYSEFRTRAVLLSTQLGSLIEEMKQRIVLIHDDKLRSELVTIEILGQNIFTLPD